MGNTRWYDNCFEVNNQYDKSSLHKKKSIKKISRYKYRYYSNTKTPANITFKWSYISWKQTLE